MKVSLDSDNVRVLKSSSPKAELCSFRLNRWNRCLLTHMLVNAA